MWAYRLFSTAMSQIGKPISRLEDIAQYLQPADKPASRPALARPSPPEAAAKPRPVYVGAPVAVDHDHMIFDTTPRLTSQLDFAPDRLGYLVNDEGLVLMGRSDDETPAQGLRLAPIRLEDGPIMPARATSAIRYKANLPRTPVVAADGAEADTGSEALAQHALAGGEINILDTRGREIIVRLRWAKLGSDSWRLLYRIMGDAMTIRAAARGWQCIAQDFAFDASGRLTDMCSVNLELGRGLEPVSIEFGRCGLTQFPDSTGLVKVLACSQNGWSKAALREVALREDGRVLGLFDNGRVALLGIAAFAEPTSCHDLKQAA
jgi:flagellar hook protein FlgE